MTKMNQNALAVMETLENAGYDAFLCGGAVRDLLLGLTPHDWDVTTSAPAEVVDSLFPNTKMVGENFGVSLVEYNGETFEVARFRRDGDYSDNRRPDFVDFTLSAEEDVARRDFTMNALLMDRNGNVYDFVGGQTDLQNGLLRAVGNPETRFTEDALRLLRAVRFAARFNLRFDRETHEAIEKRAFSVETLPPDRVSGELVKMLTGGNVNVAFKLMDNTGLLQHVLPEVNAMRGVDQNSKFHPEGDVFQHTLLMLSKLPANCSVTLALSVLLHDVAKPTTAVRNVKTGENQFFGHETVGAEMAAKMLRNLRFSNEVVDAVSSLVSQHMKFFNVTKMNDSKLKRFVRQENFSELLELNRLDSLCSNGDLTDFNFAVDFLASVTEESLNPVRLLTGNDLQAMGLKPGPMFKTLLTALENAQLDGRVTTRDEAVFFVESLTGGDR